MPKWLREGGVALITGGSSGIGFAIAEELVKKKMNVVLLARRKKLLEEAREKLSKKGGVEIVSADVTDINSLKRAENNIIKSFSKIDLLVNCAGIVKPALLQDLDYDDINSQIQINLIGIINVTKIFQKYIPRGGAILNISSGIVFFRIAGYTVYTASKVGILGFSLALRRELLSKGISVHVACPWDVDTPQYRKEQEEMPEWMKGSIRPKFLKVDVAAKKILRGTSRSRFLILSNFITRFSLFMNRFFPLLWRFLIDKIVPKPKDDQR